MPMTAEEGLDRGKAVTVRLKEMCGERPEQPRQLQSTETQKSRESQVPLEHKGGGLISAKAL